MLQQEQAALYRRWNPKTLDEICGNALAVETCRGLIQDTPPSKRPGFYLITGETGTGKSTLVHILAKGFGCDDWDFLVTTLYERIDRILWRLHRVENAYGLLR